MIGEEDKAQAAVIATSSNFIGLGLGALLAGWLADYAPHPLQLVFLLLMLAMGGVVALLWRTPETIARRQALAKVSIRPRIGVPAEIRADFVAPAITGFGAMALIGLFAGLAPSILAQQLHITSHLGAGLLFLELALVVAAVIVGARRLSSRTAMLLGLSLMIPSVGLLTAAELSGSLGVMIAATACCGIASGLGYRSGLQVVNAIAPAARRAEVVSAFLICCFLGNALPVIGIGVISSRAGPLTASIAFDAMIVVFSIVALWFGSRRRSVQGS